MNTFNLVYIYSSIHNVQDSVVLQVRRSNKPNACYDPLYQLCQLRSTAKFYEDVSDVVCIQWFKLSGCI